jgi:prepilin-type N-terminal cleavage/methylation domain-containing protein
MIKRKQEGIFRTCHCGNERAFTLAEVLITLTIIGVVAALTIPALIANNNARSWSEMQANTAFRVTQAMDQMRALGKLDGSYKTTDEFVDELQKYLKITKRCDANNLESCWSTKQVILSNGKAFDIKKCKTGKSLQLSGNNSNNVGLVLSNGVPIIISYNEKSEPMDELQNPKAFMKNLPIGQNKTKDFAYYSDSSVGVIDFIMDVNGAKPPNKMDDKTGSDVRSFNIASFTELCSGEYGGKCYKSLGIISNYNDAVKACQDLGMSIITQDEIRTVMGNGTISWGDAWYQGGGLIRCNSGGCCSGGCGTGPYTHCSGSL